MAINHSTLKLLIKFAGGGISDTGTSLIVLRDAGLTVLLAFRREDCRSLCMVLHEHFISKYFRYLVQHGLLCALELRVGICSGWHVMVPLIFVQI